MVGGLFEPVEAVAVALAVDDVGAAVVVDVVGEDGEARVTEMPVGVPLPFVVVGVDVFEPAVGGEDVGFAVAIDVADADAVAVFVFAADVMDGGVGRRRSRPRGCRSGCSGRGRCRACRRR